MRVGTTRAALRLWWRLRRAGTPGDGSAVRGVEALAVTAYAVATAALLVTLGGLHAFWIRHLAAPTADSSAYVALAATATALLVVPILTLGGVAARLTLGRRDARLAALRLAGATSGQVGVMALADAAAQAALGAVLGVGGYALAIPGLALVSFQGRRLAAAELWLGAAPLLGACFSVVALAVASGLISMAGVVVGPLGVGRRTTPGRLRLWRLALAGGLLALWLFGTQLLGRAGLGVLLAVLAGVVAGVNLVGPLFVQLAGRGYARVARSAAGLVAARRIVDDPRATWRAVSVLGLAICVAALSSFADAAPAGDPGEIQFAADLGTGALVALVILLAVGVTSTGVGQAARVVDQRETYRALALAGTPLGVLHRARLLELAVPLVVTVALGATLPILILVPMATLLGPWVVVRAALAIAVSVLALAGSVQLSRGLVNRYAASA
ncbi:MAG: hypothetical protein IPK37_00420 [Austwickia sp.]|jgi:hypothetical protein|nr:MAG: hypothetical protein IPK37_00420 [Austwickia sp.]